MNKIDNLIGLKINDLEVVGRDLKKEIQQKKKRYHQIYYICRCSCGNICSVLKTNLTSGKQKSCGCGRRKSPANFEDLTNRVFDRLTVIERDLSRNKGYMTYWLCRCECGNVVSVQASKLKSGHTKSCGCWQKEQAHNTHFKDLTGMTFGKLKVIDRNFTAYSNNKVYWNCECECGSRVVVAALKLCSFQTMSCGCIKSYGEYLIKNYLNKNNIMYYSNRGFSDCLSLGGYRLKFDFIIPDNSKVGFYIIEFDGHQHFKSNNRGWDTDKNYNRTHENDLIKNKYCFDNDIKIIRIPYTEIRNMNYNDLFLETTSFLLSKSNESEYYRKYTEYFNSIKT